MSIIGFKIRSRMVKLTKPIAIDVFCGVGGLSLGFHRTGFEVVASIDLDPINVETFSKNSPDTPAIRADVSKLSAAKVRDLAGLGQSDEIDVTMAGRLVRVSSTNRKAKNE